jgi:hypothetical protein
MSFVSNSLDILGDLAAQLGSMIINLCKVFTMLHYEKDLPFLKEEYSIRDKTRV